MYPTPVHAEMRIVSGAPAGFEKLDAPRPTLVTLSYGGEVLGNFPAHSTPLMLAFDKPNAIIAAVPAIADVALVGSVLASPLPNHAELLCGKRTESCGILQPDVAGIIFDESRLSAELFINKKYLNVVDDNAERFLPLPERKFSSVYRFDGAVSGTNQQNPNFSLGNEAVFALGEGNLGTQTTLSNQGLRFDTVSANLERSGWMESGGLMRSLPMQLAGDRDIAGVTVATSMRTRLDAHKTEGNEIILFLPRRAFVSIYREGRLYSSRNYDAGNQRIDTTELPDGAYTITLKIQEADGTAREETRFFAKSEEIPPPDAPTYYVQGGVVRKPAAEDSTLPQITSLPLLRAGTVQRVADNVGVSFGALGLSDRGALEAGMFMVTPQTQLRTTVLSSTKGDMGVQGGVVYVVGSWNGSLDARKLWSGPHTPPGYDGLFNNLTQFTGNVNYLPVPEVTLSLRGSYALSEGSVATTSLGPAMDWRLWQRGEGSLYFSADAARINGHDEGTALLRFTYRIGDYGLTSEGGAGVGGSEHGTFGSARVQRDVVTPDESLLMGAGVHSDMRTRSVSADGDWRNDFGRIQGSVQQAFGGSGTATTYGGNFAVGAAQAGSLVAIGGNEADMSAIAIETEGDADATMTIFVNGVPHSTVRVGERKLLYLTAYTIYRIRLSPVKQGLYSIEGDERKVTLYPGNVARLSWRINRFNVVAARIITADGQPLGDATLEESRASVTTDANGRFQAELTRPHSLTFTRDGHHCQVQLPPELKAVNGVMAVKEPLVCVWGSN